MTAIWKNGEDKGRGMKASRVYCIVFAALVWALTYIPTANAAGFSLYEWSARANAMGGAVMAINGDPSVVAYNPALMTKLPGTQTEAGFTAIIPSSHLKFSNGGSDDTIERAYMPPYAYITTQATDKVWFGMGLYTRFGLGTEYDENWAGASNVYKAVIETYSANPNVALKITDKLSIGFGFEVMYAKADVRQKYLGQPLIIKTDSVGFGANAAMHYQFNDQWSVGLTYRTSMKHQSQGDVDIKVASISGADQKLALTVPASTSLGIGYEPTKDLRLEFDAIYTEWSDYDSLEYSGQIDKTVTKDWHDVWRVQLGVEYDLTDWMQVRGGLVWDQSPVNDATTDYMLPTNDRIMYCLGSGFKLNDSLKLDVSYMYLTMRDREIPDAHTGVGFDTTATDNHAHLAGISLTYKF